MSMLLLAGALVLICDSRAPEFGDKRDVTCPITATGAEQRFVFKVNFIGSHDDTVLSMKPALNDQPLACEEGSKLESKFEDGEVSLECRFTVKAQAGTAQALGVAIVWTHAQYMDFSLTAQ